MKKRLSILAISFFSFGQLHADPKYVVVRQRFFSAWTITYVEKPEKNLERWLYDKEADTYYRVKSAWGTGIRAKWGKKH